MAQQRQTKVPNPLRNPLIVKETVGDLRDVLALARKQSAEEGRTERDRMKFIRVAAFLGELEKNADARLGDQLKEYEG